eukprot:137072-Rhodomonas_salina.3
MPGVEIVYVASRCKRRLRGTQTATRQTACSRRKRYRSIMRSEVLTRVMTRTDRGEVKTRAVVTTHAVAFNVFAMRCPVLKIGL